MKILHLSFSDSDGGAAIGAYRLHRAMVDRGVDSNMFVLHRGTDDPRVYPLTRSLNKGDLGAAPRLSSILKRGYGVADLPIRTFNLFGGDTAQAINRFAPDVVQFHWIANNTIRIDDIPNIQAPIVWKMADMWAYSGAEHYRNVGDPDRQRIGYDESLPFRGELVDLDRFVWEYKRRYFSDLNLTIVSPSRFLAHEAHVSKLLQSYDCHVIPNPLPAAFRSLLPIDDSAKQALRKSLELPLGRMLVMFAAFNTAEKRKGFHHILSMLEHHLPSRISPDQVSFLVIGAAEAKTEQLYGYDVISKERTSDVAQYSAYLQSSDLLLFPSEMENSAMVVQEAAACGVPVVAFDAGGMVDLVHHRKSGYLATPYEAEELADGLVWWLTHDQKEQVSSYSRQLASSAHDEGRCVERYLQVYDGALTRIRTSGSFKTGALHDRDSEIIETLPQRTMLIVDPSVRDRVDSSHNSEAAMAAYAVALVHAMRPRILANHLCSLSGVEFEPAFKYSGYDKIRAQADQRGSAPNFVDEGHAARGEHVFSVLDAAITNKLTARDVVYFPMVDRPLIDGLLRYLLLRDAHRTPTFHLNLMFEQAEFLVGGYPLSPMLRALRNSGYVGQKIFLYAETRAMANRLSELGSVEVQVLPPLPMIDPAKLEVLGGSARQLSNAFKGVYDSWRVRPSSESPKKSANEFWISALGRGRADKGWRRLPSIVTTFNRLEPSSNVRFLIQRPRKMDNLEDVVQKLAAIKNVVLLDEIVETSLLEELLAASDVMLLPYEPSVYGKRGSVFAWKAVTNLVPMVVTKRTALGDAIKWGNGIAADGDEDFARAICTIRERGDEFRAATRKAFEEYAAAAIVLNPIIRNAQADKLWKRETVLAVDMTVEELSAQVGQGLERLNVVTLRSSAAPPTLADGYPGKDEPSLLNFYAEQTVAGEWKLPTTLADALAGGRFRRIYLNEAVPENLKLAILGCGAAENLLRTMEVTSTDQVEETGVSSENRLAMLRPPLRPLHTLLNWINPSRRWTGHLDVVATNHVRGWALDRDNLDARVPLEVRIDGAIVAQGFADRGRKDLETLFSDTNRGFWIELPARFHGTVASRISVTPTGSRRPLPYNRAIVARDDATSASDVKVSQSAT